MSDDELRAVINRIQLERQLASLTVQEKTRGQKIAREVLSVLGSSAKTVATKTTTKLMTKAVEKTLNIDLGEPKKKKD